MLYFVLERRHTSVSTQEVVSLGDDSCLSHARNLFATHEKEHSNELCSALNIPTIDEESLVP